MVCYAVPAVAAISHMVMRRNITSWKENIHHLWLNFLLIGAAVFGVVDHWWNGELFLISENLSMDLLLGIVITIATIIIWAVIVTMDKSKSQKTVKA